MNKFINKTKKENIEYDNIFFENSKEFFNSVRSGDINKITILLTNKVIPNINLKNDKEENILSILLESDEIKSENIKLHLLKLLISYGLSISLTNKYKQNGLHIAYKKKYYNIVKFLLSLNYNNNDLMLKDIFGKYPINYLVYYDLNNIKTASELICSPDNIILSNLVNNTQKDEINKIITNIVTKINSNQLFDILKNTLNNISKSPYLKIIQDCMTMFNQKLLDNKNNEILLLSSESVNFSTEKNVIIDTINNSSINKLSLQDELNKYKNNIQLEINEKIIKYINNILYFLNNTNYEYYEDLEQIRLVILHNFPTTELRQIDQMLTHKCAVLPRHPIINMKNKYYIHGRSLFYFFVQIPINPPDTFVNYTYNVLNYTIPIAGYNFMTQNPNNLPNNINDLNTYHKSIILIGLKEAYDTKNPNLVIEKINSIISQPLAIPNIQQLTDYWKDIISHLKVISIDLSHLIMTLLTISESFNNTIQQPNIINDLKRINNDIDIFTVKPNVQAVPPQLAKHYPGNAGNGNIDDYLWRQLILSFRYEYYVILNCLLSDNYDNKIDTYRQDIDISSINSTISYLTNNTTNFNSINDINLAIQNEEKICDNNNYKLNKYDRIKKIILDKIPNISNEKLEGLNLLLIYNEEQNGNLTQDKIQRIIFDFKWLCKIVETAFNNLNLPLQPYLNLGANANPNNFNLLEYILDQLIPTGIPDNDLIRSIIIPILTTNKVNISNISNRYPQNISPKFTFLLESLKVLNLSNEMIIKLLFETYLMHSKYINLFLELYKETQLPKSYQLEQITLANPIVALAQKTIGILYAYSLELEYYGTTKIFDYHSRNLKQTGGAGPINPGQPGQQGQQGQPGQPQPGQQGQQRPQINRPRRGQRQTNSDELIMHNLSLPYGYYNYALFKENNLDINLEYGYDNRGEKITRMIPIIIGTNTDDNIYKNIYGLIESPYISINYIIKQKLVKISDLFMIIFNNININTIYLIPFVLTEINNLTNDIEKLFENQQNEYKYIKNELERISIYINDNILGDEYKIKIKDTQKTRANIYDFIQPIINDKLSEWQNDLNGFNKSNELPKLSVINKDIKKNILIFDNIRYLNSSNKYYISVLDDNHTLIKNDTDIITIHYKTTTTDIYPMSLIENNEIMKLIIGDIFNKIIGSEYKNEENVYLEISKSVLTEYFKYIIHKQLTCYMNKVTLLDYSTLISTDQIINHPIYKINTDLIKKIYKMFCKTGINVFYKVNEDYYNPVNDWDYNNSYYYQDTNLIYDILNCSEYLKNSTQLIQTILEQHNFYLIEKLEINNSVNRNDIQLRKSISQNIKQNKLQIVDTNIDFKNLFYEKTIELLKNNNYPYHVNLEKIYDKFIEELKTINLDNIVNKYYKVESEDCILKKESVLYKQIIVIIEELIKDILNDIINPLLNNVISISEIDFKIDEEYYSLIQQSILKYPTEDLTINIDTILQKIFSIYGETNTKVSEFIKDSLIPYLKKLLIFVLEDFRSIFTNYIRLKLNIGIYDYVIELFN